MFQARLSVQRDSLGKTSSLGRNTISFGDATADYDHPIAKTSANYYYLIEAARAGIHKPILAALYAAHNQPQLADGEIGLGIIPTNQIDVNQVNTFPEQVQFAAKHHSQPDQWID